VTESSTANLELGIVLPLGVVANQLMKIEAELRFLNMKALGYARDNGDGAVAGQIAGRLEHISEALDLIRGLVADLQSDMQRKPLPERDD
jgi:hypothetical protein